MGGLLAGPPGSTDHMLLPATAERPWPSTEPARPVLFLAFRTFDFLFYQVLLSLVDRFARPPRTTMLPEAARLYRQNIALKAQLDAPAGSPRPVPVARPPGPPKNLKNKKQSQEVAGRTSTLCVGGGSVSRRRAPHDAVLATPREDPSPRREWIRSKAPPKTRSKITSRASRTSVARSRCRCAPRRCSRSCSRAATSSSFGTSCRHLAPRSSDG
jgi:hypothetical protein